MSSILDGIIDITMSKDEIKFSWEFTRKTILMEDNTWNNAQCRYILDYINNESIHVGILQRISNQLTINYQIRIISQPYAFVTTEITTPINKWLPQKLLISIIDLFPSLKMSNWKVVWRGFPMKDDLKNWMPLINSNWNALVFNVFSNPSKKIITDCRSMKIYWILKIYWIYSTGCWTA